MGITQRLKRLLGVLVIVSFSAFAPLTAASAHTELVSSSPAANEAVNAPLPSISVTFSEPPLLEGSAIVVTDAAGTTVETAPAELSGATLSAPWPAGITPGTVKVEWRAVSDDGHPVNGDFTFEYTAAAESGAAPSATPDVTALDDKAIPTPMAVTTSIEMEKTAGSAKNYTSIVIIGVVIAAGIGIGIALNRRSK